jgi:putative ABC transport system substrate-binding protein
MGQRSRSSRHQPYGLFLDLPEIGGKQIELIKEALPELSSVAILWDSTIGEAQFRATETAARGRAVRILPLPVQRLGDFESALARAVRERAQAVVVLSSPIIFGQRAEIATLALKNRLPTISVFTLFAQSGGLMAYGPDLTQMYRRAVIYVDKILKGAKVEDLPIERPSKINFVVNLKTAKALGLVMPRVVLLRADEVIE